MEAATKTTNRRAQQDAMKNFYGIPLQDKSKPLFGSVPGVEIFWFSVDTTNPVGGNRSIFLGRRIRTTIPFLNAANDLNGSYNATNVSMVFFTNVMSTTTPSIRLKITANSGFAVHLNGKVGPYSSGSGNTNNDNNILSLQNTSLNPITGAKPWVLSSAGPNVVSGYFYNTGGSIYFNVEHQSYVPSNLPSDIPDDCTAEGKLSGYPKEGMRFYAKGECDNIGGIERPKRGNWYGNGECLIGHNIGGSYTAMCKGLNNLPAPPPGGWTFAKAGPWGPLPPSMLNLTQEAYAPMISFQVYKEPQKYNANYNFADSRLGASRMMWTSFTGTPSWVYKSEEGVQRPMGLPIVRFQTNTSMRLLNSIKMYSFMTMTIAISFGSLPQNIANAYSILTFAGALGNISINVQGNGTAGQATLKLYAETGGPGQAPVTVTSTIVESGIAYLLVLRAKRTNEADMYSLNALSLGAQAVDRLVEDPTSLVESAPITFSNRLNLSNPDSAESRTIVVGNAPIDVAFIRMYDYDLNATGVSREVNDNWQYLSDI